MSVSRTRKKRALEMGGGRHLFLRFLALHLLIKGTVLTYWRCISNKTKFYLHGTYILTRKDRK
jgi:hypothetical protein